MSANSSNMAWTNRLCIALDRPDRNAVVALADDLAGIAGVFKVGLQAFVGGGPDLVSAVASRGPVFLDLKLHDIPAQVGSAVGAIRSLDVVLATVHAAGGREMLKAAAASAGDEVTLVAVSVLTSLGDEDLPELGIATSSVDQVLRLAELALDCDIPGLVCSPREAPLIRSRFGSRDSGGPLLVVPGIRPAGSDRDDQRRTLGPGEAVDAGADLIVVGRPIANAPSPAEAARVILKEIG